jgi:hypothetical protein
MVQSARFKTLGRSFSIASEDRVGEGQAQLLHDVNGTLEHAFTAVAIIRVWVEEPRCGRGLTAEAEDASESCDASHRAHFGRGVGWRRAGSGRGGLASGGGRDATPMWEEIMAESETSNGNPTVDKRVTVKISGRTNK